MKNEEWLAPMRIPTSYSCLYLAVTRPTQGLSLMKNEE